MRPILVLLVARLYSAVSPATLHAAVSLELLHTASLVHDDVVDESTERRGQLSVNAVFNNKVSVLAGDYLWLPVWCMPSRPIIIRLSVWYPRWGRNLLKESCFNFRM